MIVDHPTSTVRAGQYVPRVAIVPLVIATPVT
jgi:hypothetical protein